MTEKVRCLKCGDENFATDPACLSCGADLSGTGESDSPGFEQVVRAEEGRVERAYMHRALGAGDHRKRRTRRGAAQARWQRIEELLPQAKGLLAQGYHHLPAPPGGGPGPAEDLSDLCREIGECYYRNGVYEQAVKWCSEAVNIHDGNTAARCFLVGALCEMEEYDLAQHWIAETPGDIIDRNVVRSWLEEPAEDSEQVPEPRTEPRQALRSGTTDAEYVTFPVEPPFERR